MDDDRDDIQIGRILTRREVLILFGAAGAATVLAACTPGAGSSLTPTTSAAASPPGTAPGAAATPFASASPSASAVAGLPSCIVRPEETEGPYFVDERIQRSDIRSDPSDGSVKDGVPLEIAFNVSRIDASGCVPFEGVLVDVWHCDALGVYSDVMDPGFQTIGKKFLRGYQVTDVDGVARFTTIYPGWYEGRTVHIHFKIRSDAAASRGLEFTSQLYFDDAVTDQVHAIAPYAQKGRRTLRNEGDRIYSGSGGNQLLVALTGDVRSGYSTVFDIGLQVA
jgi:protocatechuate 3,4-dioxygenase beta subunit